MRTRCVLLVCAVLSLAQACADRAKESGVAESATTPAPPAVTPSGPGPSPSTPVELSVTPDGIPPIAVGMRLAAAKAAVAGLEAPPAADTAQCGYAIWRGGPDGVRFMTSAGRIARVDVDSGTVPTREGAHIGDTEEQIKKLYPGVVVTPHKYTGGHYLTVTPTEPQNADNRIVFETERGRVTRYRAGKRPEVELVEGCG